MSETIFTEGSDFVNTVRCLSKQFLSFLPLHNFRSRYVTTPVQKDAVRCYRPAHPVPVLHMAADPPVAAWPKYHVLPLHCFFVTDNFIFRFFHCFFVSLTAAISLYSPNFSRNLACLQCGRLWLDSQ